MIVNCCICNVEFNVKPSRIKKLKGSKITCSRYCSSILRQETMLGSNNHQFGLIGDKNASFKGTEISNNFGYILEYCPNHPKPHDIHVQGVRVKQHRLVIERNHTLFDQKYFENINGWVVLKEEYDVHHKDEIVTNNELTNLEILSKSEHTTLHNNKKEIIRNSTNGRIIGVSKLGELLENLVEDNQQPS